VALDSVGPRKVRETRTTNRRLSPTETGCRLTLEQTMREKGHAAMNAAG
jgi:hypothetical protein